jgi:hypothetical protein
MKLGGVGGANTRTGLLFEGKTDLGTFLQSQPGYSVKEGSSVFFEGKLVARIFKKYSFYNLLKEKGVTWSELISKQLLPDNSILVLTNATLFVIECKWQQGAGSVDEKLQTCDFKKKQYQKLLKGTGIEAEYVYLLGDWFKKPGYKDVLEYIRSVECHYYFGAIPLQDLGLPLPETEEKTAL